MSFELRPYQDAALEEIESGHEMHDRVGLQMATGLGKTVVIARYAKKWQGRTMVIVPAKELVKQTCNKICRETGIYPAIEQADLRSNESCEAFRCPYVVATKQSLCAGRNGRKRYHRFEDIGLVVVDEVHYAGTRAYADCINYFTERGAKVLGVSATIRRHDGNAMSQIIDDVVYDYGIRSAVDDGWLAPIKVNAMQLQSMDLSNVSTRYSFSGDPDFSQKELNDVMEGEEVIYQVAEATARATAGLKTAIFCSSVIQARAVAVCLKEQYGVNAAWICGDTTLCTERMRSAIMSSFHSNDPSSITHVCNVGILTTGWDFPALRAIVMARPTKSTVLYTQIIGRLTRPWSDEDHSAVVDGIAEAEDRRAAIASSPKPNGLIVDLVDNSLQHKLVTAPDILGGKMTLYEARRLKARIADAEQGEVDVDQALAEERAKIRDEELKAAIERKRVAQAKFNSQEVDPYGGARSRNRQLINGREWCTDKQRRFMWVLGFKDVDKYAISKPQASRIIGQLHQAGMSVEQMKRKNKLILKEAL